MEHFCYILWFNALNIDVGTFCWIFFSPPVIRIPTSVTNGFLCLCMLGIWTLMVDHMSRLLPIGLYILLTSCDLVKSVEFTQKSKD